MGVLVLACCDPPWEEELGGTSILGKSTTGFCLSFWSAGPVTVELVWDLLVVPAARAVRVGRPERVSGACPWSLAQAHPEGVTSP